MSSAQVGECGQPLLLQSISESKTTELGLIPKDWTVVKLGDISECLIGLTYHPQDVRQYGVLVLRSSNIQNGALAFHDCVFVDTEVPDRIRVRPGDILICVRNGSRDLIGKCALLDDRVEGQTFGAFMAVLRTADYTFVHRQLTSDLIKRQVLANIGATINQITNADLRAFTIPFPTRKDERDVIAATLSDIDNLITCLGSMADKKRDIKQAAMQQLLSAKQRLPGFNGEWNWRRLEDVGEIEGAGVDKKIRAGEVPVRLVNYMDVYRNGFIFSSDLHHWVTAPQNQALRCRVKAGDVFFTPSSETRDDIANSAVAMEDIEDAAYSYHVVRLRLREEWDHRFRAYVFSTRAFLSRAEILCDGSGTRYVISLGKFRSLKVLVPPLEEQRAIGRVLYDMDRDIAALDSRRAKLLTLKQGMMQQLLTGRIRLI